MTLDVNVTLAHPGFELTAQFRAEPGVTVLFGPSGSGKTTILNLIAGLQTPDRGTIRWRGTNWATVPTHKRRIGYVFQDGRLFPHLTVRNNLLFGAASESDLTHIVDLLGIADLLDRMPKSLSGGERQRVALGRAFLSGPDILCMDEPLSALDGPRRQEILPYFERIARETGIPILYVTHELTELTRLADRVIVLSRGRIVGQGPVENVLSDPDLASYFPGRSLGAVIQGTVGETHDGLTDVAFDGGILRLTNVPGALGSALRLRVAAQDLILSDTRPTGLSALNVLKAQVLTIAKDQSGVLVVLTIGATRLLARITEYSANTMMLAEGQDVFAIVKATAVDPAALG